MDDSTREPDPAYLHHVEALFAEALDYPPDERDAFLDQACPDAPDVRAEVASLLGALGESDQFLAALDPDQAAALLEAVGEPVAADGRVGPYQLVRELGRGGMGTVYLAQRAVRDEKAQFDQEVALKLIKRGMDSDGIVRRFLTERQILARLRHDNIARLLDGGVTDEGRPYFAMEYVKGVPITAYCDAHQLDVNQRLRLFQHVCDAVQYAHRNLVVHRDLKPSNILVADDGKVQLLDFGIAKLLDEEAEAGTTTLTGMRAMTPEYAAPEQVQGEPVTTATDVYALGVVLYELLTGHRPYRFERRAPDAMARVICETEPTHPSTAVQRVEQIRQADGTTETITPEAVSRARHTQPDRLRRQLSGDLDTVILKALQKEPERRYASAEAFLEDIKRYLAGLPVQAQRDTLAYRATKFIRRHTAGVVATTLVILSLVAGLVGMTWQAAIAAAERDRARQEAVKAEQIKDFALGLFTVSDPVDSGFETLTARELLEQGLTNIDQDLQAQPELQAEMLGVIGTAYRHLEQFDKAAPLLERALVLRRSHFGTQHPAVAQSLNDLASLALNRGDYDAADSLHRQALALRRHLLAPDHIDMAESLSGLGQVRLKKGNYAAADSLYREALAVYQKVLGTDHTYTLTVLESLGVVATMQGDLDAAEVRFRDILRRRRNRLGADHPLVAVSLGNLAGLLQRKGDYAAALPLRREALALDRAQRGDDNPKVARSMQRLALTLRYLGELEEAEALYREALAMQRTLLGNEHPDVATTLNNLASLLQYKGDYAAAEPLYRDVLAMDRALLGGEHPYVAGDLHNLAGILTAIGKPEAALPLFDEALAMNRRLRGPDHPEVATNLHKRAVALRRLDRFDEAVPLIEQALTIYRSQLGDRHPKVAYAVLNLAATQERQHQLAAADSLYRQALSILNGALPAANPERALPLIGLGRVALAQGRPEAAEPLLRQALELRRQGLPDGHWRRAEAQSLLGACLSALGRFEEAEPLLLAGYDRLKETPGKQHETQRALEHIVGLYEAWGQPDKAAPYRALRTDDS